MKDSLKISGFEWDLQIVNPDGSIAIEEKNKNTIPSDALNFLMRTPFGDKQPISTFYLGLYRGNYIPTPNTTAADIPTAMNEFVEYSQESRPEWQRKLEGVATMNNLSEKAEFTVTQDRTIYGAFLVSSQVKGTANGLVLSCVRFSSPKQVTAGQLVRLAGGLTYTSTNVI